MEGTIKDIMINSKEKENEADEYVDTILTGVQRRQNELSQKILALKASTESLKEQLKMEKKKWLKEIQETVELDKQMRKSHENIRSMLEMDENERKIKLDIFKEYLFFTNATMNLQTELKKKNYQEWLSEIANECSQELSKVQDSLTVLKPLKEIASKWSEEDSFDDKSDINFSVDEKGQGDGGVEGENTNSSVD